MFLNALYSNIIPALIGTVGVIITAFLSVGVVRDSLNSRFYVYADSGHNAKSLFNKAKYNIYIVANCANFLFEKNKTTIEDCLRNGITVNVLLINEEPFFTMDNYIKKGLDNKYHDFSALIDSLNILKSIKSKLKYEGLSVKLNVRLFSSILTASYIGIDLNIDDEGQKGHLCSSLMQVMIYQYQTETKNSPILFLSKKKNRTWLEKYEETTRKLWDDPNNQIITNSLGEYINKLESMNKLA